MGWSNAFRGGSWIRQLHRWVSMAFTATVIVNFIIRVKAEPPLWVTYSPLLPLAVLLLTGLYLFALPYFARSRSGRKV
jgi:predicted metal-binding membrane protein